MEAVKLEGGAEYCEVIERLSGPAFR